MNKDYKTAIKEIDKLRIKKTSGEYESTIKEVDRLLDKFNKEKTKNNQEPNLFLDVGWYKILCCKKKNIKQSQEMHAEKRKFDKRLKKMHAEKRKLDKRLEKMYAEERKLDRLLAASG